jgi:cysteinyl-tRNA synthetase
MFSAMAGKYLGQTFDIHGGGIDLVFPHHENEIAQSECAHHGAPLAKVWMHNGFLQVEGEKMSKSAGNFFTIRELLADWPGEVLRFNMLRSHYRQPMDFTLAGLKESWKTLERWYERDRALGGPRARRRLLRRAGDDLNTPAAIASLHQADDLALAGGLGFLGFSNVQMKYRRQDQGGREWSPSPTPSPPAGGAQGARISPKATASATICWPRALC